MGILETSLKEYWTAVQMFNQQKPENRQVFLDGFMQTALMTAESARSRQRLAAFIAARQHAA
ncbi:hypothetical protein ACUN0C_18190 [Faunimonas sp. B44]|uniref:hypothetical protein n=1 Tax=Faunimonas sp. B44 TaxID=3461493 RepID=UPI00404432F2